MDREPVHVHDLTAAGVEFPEGREHAIRMGHRTTFSVPLLREDQAIGSLSLRRTEVRPFTDKQIELIETFADQAVIAIENVRLFDEVQARTCDLSESLEQQTATSEVLRVISSSPGELQPVFEPMLQNATRICEAKFGAMWFCEGDAFRVAARQGYGALPAAFTEQWRSGTVFRPSPDVPIARVAQSGRALQIPDLREDQSYLAGDPLPVSAVDIAGTRTLLAIPMLKENEVVGVIAIFRQEVRLFSDKQIELITNFAAQAVIAIENTRLLNELRESLQQQTATADVLKVISRSTFDLPTVLNTLVESAARLCEADMAGIVRPKGEILQFVANYGYPSDYQAYMESHPIPSGRGSVTGRAVLEGRTIHISDVLADPDYKMTDAARIGSIRTLLGVPLMREGTPIGVIALQRNTVRPFTDKQIELVTTFADQAVIAIENVRLFDEVQARTRELSEALEQQTATSEVLQVISSSPGELGPVFDTMLEKATRICQAKFGTLYLREGDAFRAAALHNAPPAFADMRKRGPVRPGPRAALSRMLRTKQVVHIPDMAAEQTYIERDPLIVTAVELGGFRTFLCVPMLKDNEVLGAIAIYRQEVKPFSDKQIALLVNFASQAVIAIENTRLLSELRESLQQQTATADVLKVISRSTFDLQAVLDTLAESAVRVCEAYDAVIFLRERDRLRTRAHHGPIPMDIVEWRIGRGWVNGRAFVDRQPVHVHDLQAAVAEFPDGSAMALRLGHRTILAIPLLREDEAIGTLGVRRTEVRPFTDKQIALLTTFADQAVIAIENVRLFDEVQARTRELSEALEQQTATSEVLDVISRSPGELQPVFQAMLENATRICEASFGNMLLYDGDVFRRVALHNAPQAWAADFARNPIVPRGLRLLYRVADTKQIVHIADAAAETPDEPIVRFAGARTLLIVPMLKENDLIGAIGIYRQEVRPFTDKQIELVTNFAAQAVIAIENTRLLSELRESLQQQTATADVLKVISRSTFDLQPVLDTLIESAVRLCEADMGSINRQKGDAYRQVANFGHPPALDKFMETHPLEMGRGTLVGRTVLEGRTVHVPDVQADPEYTFLEAARLAGLHTMLGVPLLREGTPIGVIVLQRTSVRPFTEKQIELVTTFADQAVIAIENVRLFDEVQARTRELTESLEQQTATSEVLQVISSSPGELGPVFDTMLEKATRICGAKFGTLYLREGDAFRAAALHNAPPAFADFRKRGPVRPSPRDALNRVLTTKQMVHIADMTAEPAYIERDPMPVAAVELGGFRTLLCVPMQKENEVLGAISIYRQEVQPFSDKQIALLVNFASQAVIAIENTRLLSELRESLAQQTATADVLDVISRSAFDLEPVFETVVENAVRLCGADRGFLFRFDGELLRMAASYNASSETTEWVRRNPVAPGRHSVSARAALERRTVQVTDVQVDPEYAYAVRDVSAIRTVLGVPMLKNDALVGVIAIYRLEVKPFTDKQIALMETFADQAVIAIENVRLFDEVQARTSELARSVEELRALGAVSQAVNSTLDLETVLETIVAKATQISGTEAGAIYVLDERQKEFQLRATYGMSQELITAVRNMHAEITEAVGLLTETHEPSQQADLRDLPFSPINDTILRAGYRARLVVPLMRFGDVIGALVVRRKAPGAFPASIVELLETFAAQSALAIQNARMFSEIGEKSRQLEIASRHKSQFLANMSHELRTPLNAIIGVTEMLLEDARDLKRDDEVEPLDRVLRAARHLLALINDILDLSKIEAGRMELHLESFPLAPHIEDVVKTIEPLTAKNGNRIVVDCRADIGTIHADQTRFRQALL
ncbi:MAG TPA: GAF domain-containing protein, partial [Pseudomonadota bacterium]|nr:GAF domain-containing protein [Pseudomonadota bacterium]